MVKIIMASIKHLFIILLFFFTISGVSKLGLLSIVNSLKLLSVIGFYLIITRILILAYTKKNRLKGNDSKEVYVIGQNNQTTELVSFLSDHNQYGYKLLGVFSDRSSENEKIEIQSLLKLRDKVKSHSIKEVFICTDKYLSRNKLADVLKLLNNNFVKINIVPDFNSVLNLDLTRNYINYLPIYTSERFSFEKNENIVIKRIFDIIFSSVFLILIFSWALPIFALITKITSKGSIFYLQERIGLNGKKFKIIKFRSMKTDAELQSPLLSSDEDPRITKWGKIMRRYRIDELPQFINVFRGNMSVVGPRPEREFFINEIKKLSPYVKLLQKIKPGITSLGQTLFGYAENVNEMRQRLRYDLLYLKNYSIVMDLKIIFLTIMVIIRGKGK